MSEPRPGTQDGARESRQVAEEPPSEINWIAVEESPEFKELVAARRRFVLPGTIFFFAAYFGFILLSGYAGGFMGTSIYRGLTVGYVAMLGLFVMVWAMVFLYLRQADNVFDPLARRAAAKALEAGKRPTPPDGAGSDGGPLRDGNAALGTTYPDERSKQ